MATNVIAVDGGTTVDPALGRTGGGTCNYGINVNFDAEVANPNGTRRHYLDIDGVNELYQTLVVPSCGSGDTRPRTLRFSGYFSSRDTGTGGSGTVRLLRGNVQVAGSRVQPVDGEGVLLASVSSPPHCRGIAGRRYPAPPPWCLATRSPTPSTCRTPPISTTHRSPSTISTAPPPRSR
ncbi:hypothetical protein H0I39_20165 [Ottowia beijingensis]|uniref:Uncharacterized protein n=1 Tax=Ottowia beijingensis TaxID=1207057 RepID=A0A853IZN4_9BURK|nr:hypothetical protein [Ottowia beijingensis]NZA03426.1 hypothetical protein [Ottowia beijingensis]